MNATAVRFAALILLTAVLAALNVYFGSVDIPARTVTDVLTGSGAQHGAVEYIILSSRIPQMLTAIIAGAALAASGLLLQTAFRNPLAGPSVLGINSGASLGVAVVILLFGGSVSVRCHELERIFCSHGRSFCGQSGRHRCIARAVGCDTQ